MIFAPKAISFFFGTFDEHVKQHSYLSGLPRSHRELIVIS